MRNHVTDDFPHGPDDEVLGEFGVNRESFVSRFREILLENPPDGLDHGDVATLLAAYS